ncbi:unnamed protein product, partial [Cochlearia groenlandica]
VRVPILQLKNKTANTFSRRSSSKEGLRKHNRVSCRQTQRQMGRTVHHPQSRSFGSLPPQNFRGKRHQETMEHHEPQEVL